MKLNFMDIYLASEADPSVNPDLINFDVGYPDAFGFVASVLYEIEGGGMADTLPTSNLNLLL